jgi:hypothetical protein
MESALGTNSRSSSTRFAATAVCNMAMSDVLSRMAKACDEAYRDRITSDVENDRNCVCVAALAASAEVVVFGIAITAT